MGFQKESVEVIMVEIENLFTILKKTKLIWNTRQTFNHQDWVLFDGKNVYIFNGVLFYHEPYVSPVGALPAHQVLTMMEKAKSSTAEIKMHDTYSGFAIDGKYAKFNYPFVIRDHAKSFYKEDGDFALVHGVEVANAFCSLHTFKQNIEYNNTFIHENRMFATDGYKYAIAHVESPDAILPQHITPIVTMFDAPIRGICNTDSTISMKLGNGILTSTIPDVDHKNVTKYEPDFQTLTSSVQIIDIPAIKNILDTASKFDLEFKRKDLMVDVSIDKEVMRFQLNGIKMTLNQTLACDGVESPMNFRVSPSNLKDLFLLGDILHYSPKVDYVATTGQNGEKLFLWVELL